MKSLYLLMLLVALTWCGCGKPDQSQAPQSKQASPAASKKHRGRDNVKVVDADGRVIWRLKADKKGYRVYSKDDELIVRIKTYQDHIKAENEGKTIFRLQRRGKKYKTWVAEDDAKNYGYAVVNGKNQVVCKMKVEEDAVVAEGPDGKKLMEMRGSTSAVAASALALESFDMPRRTGLFAFLHQWEAGDLATGI